MSTKDGGAAFPPRVFEEYYSKLTREELLEEMRHTWKHWRQATEQRTLRDWFAGQALMAMVRTRDHGETYGRTATLAYEYADAMLAEREKK